MPIIDYKFYRETIYGYQVPPEAFDTLAKAADAVIEALITSPDGNGDREFVEYTKKIAAAFEIEELYSNGGIDAIAGLSPSLSGGTEKVGSYSVTREKRQALTIYGMPVSATARLLLRRAALTGRSYRQEDLAGTRGRDPVCRCRPACAGKGEGL